MYHGRYETFLVFSLIDSQAINPTLAQLTREKRASQRCRVTFGELILLTYTAQVRIRSRRGLAVDSWQSFRGTALLMVKLFTVLERVPSRECLDENRVGGFEDAIWWGAEDAMGVLRLIEWRRERGLNYRLIWRSG
ncbi:hypothetical protein Tco_0128943 [Tanacetum coccineum]